MATLFGKTRRALTWFGGIYAFCILILALPFAQRHALYAHKVKWPLGARFDMPERYGLAPGRVLNAPIATVDNITLGSWFIFADTYYQHSKSREMDPSFSERDLRDALRRFNTIIYFHGNAASRAAPHRVRFYSQWTSRLDVNVLAIDYRGFGDSEGFPSEEGLGFDGRAAWDWLISRGADPSNILLFGQSLGTGVVAKLAHSLSTENVRPRGAVFSGAFTDLATLLETYNIAGLFPLLQPFQIVPFFFRALNSILHHKFSTITILPNITCPLLLIHGEDDFDIQITHSERLFEAALEPYLEPYPFSYEEMADLRLKTEEQRLLMNDVVTKRRKQKLELVKETPIANVGSLLSFNRPGQGSVNFLKSRWGGHNQVINFEGVMDVTQRLFQL
ncbi:hypothetical protein FRB91_004785 [Serendipita sp. 411]|nr:hypothetical protein FRB91_004785 [Serendipita sp. 411]